MRLLICSIFLTFFSGCLSALTPEQLAQIDSVVNDVFFSANHVTGMSLSVVLNGETVLSKGYGKRDIENDLDVQNDTLFSIGSISKSFFATLVVKTLSEKYPTYGEGILDIPIAHLNPGFNNFNFTFSDRFRAEQTSFRDLLSHRTCLYSPDWGLLFGTMRTNGENNYRTRYQKQACGHRTNWEYNNGLYALMAEIIASFEGKTSEQLVRDFMLEIGMQNSTTIDTSGSYEDLPNMSQGYYRKDGQIGKFNQKLLRRVDTGLGAGGILSTSDDMAKYALFHLNKGKVGDKQVVSEEALSWLYKPSIHLVALAGKQSENDEPTMETYAYGLGFQISFYDGYAINHHGGYWPPYNSQFMLFPAKNIGIFLSTNGPGTLSYNEVTHAHVGVAIFDIVTGSRKFSLTKPIIPVSNPDIEYAVGNFKKLTALQNINSNSIIHTEKLSRVDFENVTGIYGEEQAGDITISLDPEDNNFLQFNMSGEWGIGRLLPVNGSETLFLVEWKTDILQHYYTYPPELNPAPIVYIEFRVNSLYLIFNGVVNNVYVRNATIESFPAIPWDPVSCGPY